jgi:uncharacterized protein with NRDE domain
MCLILLAWRAHPHYPLVIAANRDEYHARAAAAASWWQQPPILAGRDLSAGGTWLALTRDGRFAALTNYRDPSRQLSDAPSRGGLIPAMLATTLCAADQLQRLRREGAAYNGFNLIFSDGAQLAIHESVTGTGRLLQPGVYGLSNHLLDTPWPKLVNAKAALGAALTRLPDEKPLLELLRDEQPAHDAWLPRTGVSQEWERMLSSAFVRSDTYGTRCSNLVLMNQLGQIRFTEWTWNASGELQGEVKFSFQRSTS